MFGFLQLYFNWKSKWTSSTYRCLQFNWFEKLNYLHRHLHFFSFTFSMCAKFVLSCSFYHMLNVQKGYCFKTGIHVFFRMVSDGTVPSSMHKPLFYSNTSIRKCRLWKKNNSKTDWKKNVQFYCVWSNWILILTMY